MENPVNTKDQILNVSLKLFAEKSYHGASIRDIAKEIGKRESSIYNHFKSKEEILEQIILKFSNRNFGTIILTDQLINKISKPEKFFALLGENLLKFWNTDEERMFIKILLTGTNAEKYIQQYNLENYVADFRNLCEFIFKEMMNHKFINKFELSTLSRQFISPLFLFIIELFLGTKKESDQKELLKSHVEFFWKAIKR
jgi:AcrR family transcriptional regulator